MQTLSANEEVTLRRVALGLTPPGQLPSAHLKRLSGLMLIEATAGIYRLTPLGRQCYESLPRPLGWENTGWSGTIEQFLADAVRRGP